MQTNINNIENIAQFHQAKRQHGRVLLLVFKQSDMRYESHTTDPYLCLELGNQLTLSWMRIKIALEFIFRVNVNALLRISLFSSV